MLSILVFIHGCSSTEDRERGKLLQEATGACRRKYKRALKLITNPLIEQETLQNEPLSDKPDQVSEKAIAILDEVAEELDAAIKKDDALRKKQKDEGNPPPAEDSDRATAMMLWSNVADKKGNHYRDVMISNIKYIERELREADGALDTIREGCKDIYIYKDSTGQADEFKSKSPEVTSRSKEVTAEKKKVEGEIETIDSEIARLEKEIQENSRKAAELKAESSLSEDAEGMKKLLQAQSLQKKVYEAQLSTRDKRRRKRQKQIELERLNAQLAAAQGRTEDLSQDISDAEKSEGRISEKLKARAAELTAAAQRVKEQLDKAAALTVTCAELAEKAGRAYKVSVDKVGDARSEHAPDDIKSNFYQEEGSVLHDRAKLDLALYQLNTIHSTFLDKRGKTWQFFYQIQEDSYPGKIPELPVNKDITDFISGTENVKNKAAALYAQALEKFDNAVEASPAPKEWMYMRCKLSFLLDYASSLDYLGSSQEAMAQLAAARRLLPKAQEAADRVGKSTALRDVRKAMEDAGGIIGAGAGSGGGAVAPPADGGTAAPPSDGGT